MSRFASKLAACILGLAFLALCPTRANCQLQVEQKISYLGSQNNIRLSNGTVELILTTDYGPRIMRYAFVGSSDEDNVLGTIPGPTLHTVLGDWYIRGGHRVWSAPEANPRSYVPDNGPIQAVIDGSTVKLTQPIEAQTGVQKEIWVSLDSTGSHATVTCRLTNRALFAIDMAVWSMSAMNKGGRAILPQEPYASHDVDLQPARPMVLWSYTDLTDPRWLLGKSYLCLRQDPERKEAQKVGVANKQGWAAYAHNGALFLKRFSYDEGKTYPDFGCNNETFTNDVFLELETLGPIVRVEPGQTIEQVEHWWLFKNVDVGQDEASIAAAMLPILTKTSYVKEKAIK